jgi:hypothetical protein
MQRWGHSRQGKPRFFCPLCRKSATPERDDVERRNTETNLRGWLLGKESLSEIAADAHMTRQGLWKRFQPLIKGAGAEPSMPDMIKAKMLIVDGTYIHGHTLCALVAIDEHDKLYWKFVPYETYHGWLAFLSSFSQPDIIIMDGQKGLFRAAKTLWPRTSIQRCQFHLVAFAMQYIGRRPKEDAGKDLMAILYRLKEAKTFAGRDAWIKSYRTWERTYDHFLGAKDAQGKFFRPRLRSTRLIIRRALPNLFAYLDHPGSPNTTNLVEGWVNGAMAEALRLHRGLREHEKRALASTVFSNLKRKTTEGMSDEERGRWIEERLKKAERARTARRFIKRNAGKKIDGGKNAKLPLQFGLSKL